MTNPNGNTSLDPNVAGRVAEDHRNTATSIGTDQVKKFQDAVDYMDQNCDGAMMRALLKAQSAWNDELKLIVADLNEMAGNVDGTIQDFDAQDYANAGGVGKVGVGILHGLG
jgi:hypothetical protein